VVAALLPLLLGVVLFVENIPPPWVTVSYAPLRACIAPVTIFVPALAALLASIGYITARRMSASFFKESEIAISIVSIGRALLIGIVGTLFVLPPHVFVQPGPIERIVRSLILRPPARATDAATISCLST